MATFTIFVSVGDSYWQRVETPATNERAVIEFLLTSWSKDQCRLNFLEKFLTEYSPESLSRIFAEKSVASSVCSRADGTITTTTSSVKEGDDVDDDEVEESVDAEESVEAEESVDTEESVEAVNEMNDDDELILSTSSAAVSSASSATTSSTIKTQSTLYETNGDVIMRPANIYDLSEQQRDTFITEIKDTCQPVRARRRFFQLCRENFPSIVFVKPEGLL